MGRTNPTYRDSLRRLESEWEPMRRALRREYQSDFDRLFDRGRTFADAAGYANPRDPGRALLLSLALAHEVELRRLREELEGEARSASNCASGPSARERTTNQSDDGEPTGDSGANSGGDGVE